MCHLDIYTVDDLGNPASGSIAGEDSATITSTSAVRWCVKYNRYDVITDKSTDDDVHGERPFPT